LSQLSPFLIPSFVQHPYLMILLEESSSAVCLSTFKVMTRSPQFFTISLALIGLSYLLPDLSSLSYLVALFKGLISTGHCLLACSHTCKIYWLSA
jgi:hypothetical protein